MSLTRDTVTAASRIMLPTYVAVFTILGYNYLATKPATLLASPALRFADSVVALQIWGVMFVGMAIVAAVALWRRRRTPYRFALRFCGLTLVLWTVVVAAAAGPFGCLLAALYSLGASLFAMYVEKSPKVAWRLLALTFALVLIGSIVPNGVGSPGGFAWVALAATACFASDRSLQLREV